jgi:hypothetical protein
MMWRNTEADTRRRTPVTWVPQLWSAIADEFAV